jgi:tetratricopeptide (TPR) repeat protein
MRRTVDIKFLASLVVVLLVAGVGVHFLHAYQVQRNVQGLLYQADRAREAGDNEQLAKYLSRYLAKVPTDTDALARYGTALDELATTPEQRLRAFLVLEQVLRREPSRQEIRRQLVRIAMHEQMQRFTDARQHLETLLREASGDAELEHALGRCHAAGGEFVQAAEWFEKAIRHAPGQVDSYVALAVLLRQRLEQPQKADQVMEQMVSQNPKSFRAFLARGRYWRELAVQEPATRDDRLKRAAQDLARAGELAPDEADVLLAVADLARFQGQSDAARACLERGLKLHPKNATMYLALSDLDLQAGRRPQAIAGLRRGLEALPDNAELLWALAHVRIQDGQKAEEEIARLSKKDIPRARLDYLQARLQMNRGDWLKAVPILERVHADLARWPELARQADLLLAECYGRMGNLDQQYVAYRRAAAADPLWPPACLGMAATLASMGQVDEALDAYRKLLPRVPEVRLAVARLLLVRNLALPAAQREWKEIHQLLDEAEKAKPDHPEVTILRAEVLAASGKAVSARELLTAAQVKHPQQVEFWIALAALAERQGQPRRALSLLNEAVRQLGDRPELRLAQARYWLKRGGKEAGPALTRLETGLDSFPEAARHPLLRGLAEAHARTGNAKKAAQLWARLAAELPLDLGIKLTLFDLALQTGDEAGVQRALTDMETIEGANGALVRCARATLLIEQGRKGDKQALEQAQTLISQVAGQRPSWPRVPLMEAEVHELRGDSGSAIKSYQRAVELGERSPEVIRRAAQLLYERRRYAEADELIQKLPDHAPLSGDLQRLAAELSVRRHDYTRAVKLAHQAVSSQSKDYRDYIWLGQVLRATPQSTEAEPHLRKAVELAPKVPDTWVALIQYLAHAGRKEQAEEAIRAAQAQLPAEQAPLALAQCHEALGQREQAQRLYRKALAAQPEDVSTRRAAAGFYLRTGQPREAEPHLRKLIDLQAKSAEDAAWARRILAIVLAAGGDYQQARDALALLGVVDDMESSRLPEGGSIEDQRARALVLATQKSHRQRRKAITILENVLNRQPASADDQFLLARLYESVGDWPRARERMTALLVTQGDKPLYISHFAHSLLRRGEVAEAQLWIDKLQRLPEAAGTLATIELQARLLAARGKAPDAMTLLLATLEGKDLTAAERQARLPVVAATLEDLGRLHSSEKGYVAAAERLLREYVAQRPEKVLALVACLGRQGRVAEALDLCEKAWQSCPPAAVAGACLAVLHVGTPTPAQMQRVERWLEAARARNAKADPNLLMCLADLRDLQGRYGEAIALYRQVLAQDPHHVMVLNNLAYLLALKEGKGNEALDLLKKALTTAGPLAELLDTRALVYLSLGRADLALKDLEEAAREGPAAAVYFHLAQAHLLARDRAAATDALRRARGLGLQASQLHALERPILQRLGSELEVR